MELIRLLQQFPCPIIILFGVEAGRVQNGDQHDRPAKFTRYEDPIVVGDDTIPLRLPLEVGLSCV